MDSLYLSAAEDAEGFGTSDVGVGEEVIWPLVLNEEGGEFIVGEGAEVDLEWLLWNQGGTVSVGKLRWFYQDASDPIPLLGGGESVCNCSSPMFLWHVLFRRFFVSMRYYIELVSS